MDAMKQVGTGFRMVYTGLMLKVLGVVIFLVGFIFLVGGAINAGPGGAGAVAGGAVVLTLVTRGLVFTGSLVELIGRIKCLAIPQSLVSAKQLIVASVCLQAITMILTILILLNELAGPFLPLGLTASLGLVNMIFWIASEIVFIQFIKAVARGIRRRDLEKKAGSVLSLAIVLTVLYVINTVVTIVAIMNVVGGGVGGLQAAAGGGMIAAVLGLAILVLGIITLIFYARLLLAMQAACNKYSYNAAYDDDEEDDDYDDRPRKKRRDDDDDDDR
jgi:hypothetical protein